MAKISVFKQETTAFKITNDCPFLTEEWEREQMWNALLAAFKWAERTSEVVDPDAPYAIVKEGKKFKMY